MKKKTLPVTFHLLLVTVFKSQPPSIRIGPLIKLYRSTPEPTRKGETMEGLRGMRESGREVVNS